MSAPKLVTLTTISYAPLSRMVFTTVPSPSSIWTLVTARSGSPPTEPDLTSSLLSSTTDSPLSLWVVTTTLKVFVREVSDISITSSSPGPQVSPTVPVRSEYVPVITWLPSESIMITLVPDPSRWSPPLWVMTRSLPCTVAQRSTYIPSSPSSMFAVQSAIPPASVTDIPRRSTVPTASETPSNLLFAEPSFWQVPAYGLSMIPSSLTVDPMQRI